MTTIPTSNAGEQSPRAVYLVISQSCREHGTIAVKVLDRRPLEADLQDMRALTVDPDIPRCLEILEVDGYQVAVNGDVLVVGLR